MHDGLLLTYGSLLFNILLMIIYYAQKKSKQSTRNKIYSSMLITVLIISISEILSIMALESYLDGKISDQMLKTIYSLHWVTALVLFLEIFIYSIVFFGNNEYIQLKKLRKNNIKIIFNYIFIIFSAIMTFFLPFEYFEKGLPSYTPGTAALWVLFSAGLTVVNIFVYGSKIFNTLTRDNKKYLVTVIILGISIITFQFVDKTISFYPLGLTILLYALYFIVENPDLYVIKELEKVKGEIEKSNRAKNDFLSNMSHEIRTPMNSIVGLSENLIHMDGFDEVAIRQDINNISVAGNNLLEIIDNILDISKIESGKEELSQKEYSLATLIKELASIVTIRIGERPIKLVIDIANNIPNKLYGDSTKISQVLLNILNNSVKYTEIGKIKLTITCDSTKEVSKLHFKVSDTGYGIKPEDYDKLFTKFNRLDDATDKEIEGTGLGLVITKKYVTLMGGKIWFESEYGAGTTFYIDIPQKIIDNSNIKFDIEKTDNASTIDYINCTGRKALIVDDNKLNLVVAARLLEPYHFDVKTLKSGKECINDIKKGHKYDIIFLDHMMPGMDGIEVLHVLKKLKDYYEIPPIIALTANAISGMKERYIKEGFNEYLSKPIDSKELNYIIKKYVEPNNEITEEIEIPTLKEETKKVEKQEEKEEKTKELGVLERLRMRE